MESLKISSGKEVLIFLQNGFRFEGRIMECDGIFLKIHDTKKSCEKFIRLNEITEVELR